MSDGFSIVDCYERIGCGLSLDERTCAALRENQPPDFQLASLAVKLCLKEKSTYEQALLSWILEKNAPVRNLISIALPQEIANSETSRILSHDELLHETGREVLARIGRGRRVGKELLIDFIAQYLKGDVSKPAMATALALICAKGLQRPDVLGLTYAMVHSGKIIDHRPFAETRGKKLLRRYPTGGISEKVSLVLPSVLMALSDELPILATILVGRSLGFTGGTWDKLSVIPGFKFPEPEVEVKSVLEACSIAMCTTGSVIDPADRELYLLRSQTGNVVSEPLIVSSIASKHLALPPHRILLDVRFGSGAFLPTQAEAQSVSTLLCQILEGKSIECTSMLLDTSQMTGTAIGNALEVMESLAVMGGRSDSTHINMSMVWSQRSIVMEQVAELCLSEFPLLERANFKARVDELFRSGAVLSAFWRLLQAHSVSDRTVLELQQRPSNLLLAGLDEMPVSSVHAGRLVDIDLKRIGNIVNFSLGPPKLAQKPGENKNGVWLHVQKGDQVILGEKLCTALFDSQLINEADQALLCLELQECFTMEMGRDRKTGN